MESKEPGEKKMDIRSRTDNNKVMNGLTAMIMTYWGAQVSMEVSDIKRRKVNMHKMMFPSVIMIEGILLITFERVPIPKEMKWNKNTPIMKMVIIDLTCQQEAKEDVDIAQNLLIKIMEYLGCNLRARARRNKPSQTTHTQLYRIPYPTIESIALPNGDMYTRDEIATFGELFENQARSSESNTFNFDPSNFPFHK